ncbi:cell division protein ZapA [Maritalea mobilis]|uniref:Cell division protein ZapA n=1 Tax=[Roseibacterium] beibuensis TaxID=1193142 RepID=A0ABP9LMB9_9RHOB|nr:MULTISPECIES: cell division protein ZapA [Alphaproteobacteria]MBY6199905.1 cell division protein ZapA [Maritalea mobilis]MCS6625855.1 cell division protein ZapA [Roseibacterium beibuensis]
MPEVEIEIGGRTFTVACQEGEEPYLRAAAKMLDTEATVVLGQIGRMPSDRMLLMAGLMLADKTAALEDELRETQAKVGAQEKALRSAEERLADRARRIAELQEAGPRTELPDSVTDGLAELAARAEALADEVESKQG